MQNRQSADLIGISEMLNPDRTDISLAKKLEENQLLDQIVELEDTPTEEFSNSIETDYKTYEDRTYHEVKKYEDSYDVDVDEAISSADTRKRYDLIDQYKTYSGYLHEAGLITPAAYAQGLEQVENPKTSIAYLSAMRENMMLKHQALLYTDSVISTMGMFLGGLEFFIDGSVVIFGKRPNLRGYSDTAMLILNKHRQTIYSPMMQIIKDTNPSGMMPLVLALTVALFGTIKANAAEEKNKTEEIE